MVYLFLIELNCISNLLKGGETIKDNERKRGKRIIPLIIIIIFILLLLLVCFFKSCSTKDNKSPSETTTSASELDFTPASGERPTIQIPSQSGLYFEAYSLNQKFDFENPAANRCYIILEIFLSDNTLIYKSDKIYPSESLTDIQLNQELKEGIYRKCRIKYNCYSVENGKELNSAESFIEINSKRKR